MGLVVGGWEVGVGEPEERDRGTKPFLHLLFLSTEEYQVGQVTSCDNHMTCTYCCRITSKECIPGIRADSATISQNMVHVVHVVHVKKLTRLHEKYMHCKCAYVEFVIRHTCIICDVFITQITLMDSHIHTFILVPGPWQIGMETGTLTCLNSVLQWQQ